MAMNRSQKVPKYVIKRQNRGQKSGIGNFFFIFVCVWILDMDVDMKH